MNLFDTLESVSSRPAPFSSYTAETLWNDDHISKQMLRFHLDQNTDLASRKIAFIDESVAWMAERFHIGPGTRIADFGCGPGLYASRLARLGARVTGVDFSNRSINYARRMATEEGLEIDYVRSNYLDYDTDERFDLIAMIYCDFCPLSPAQRRSLLGRVRTLLADDGAFFLDVCSLAAFEKRTESATWGYRLMDGFWSPGPYYGFRNTFRYDLEKVTLDKYTVVGPDRTFTVCNWLQYYDLDAVRREFGENGFRVEDAYADVRGRPFSDDAPEMAMVARTM